MDGQPPALSFHGPRIARVTFRRPNQGNCIEMADLALLHSFLGACEANDEVGVLLLTAVGRTFSSGFDLRALKEQAAAPPMPEPGNEVAFEAFANHLAASRLITIAAVNGPAIGGASDLVLSCDLRIGSETASLMMPAARFGLPLYAGALRRYVEAFGPAKAKDLILTGATIPADELQRYGIVSEIVEDDALETGAIALAIRMAELPAVPAQAMKQAINAFAGSVIDEQTWRRTLNLAFDGPAILTRIETALAMRRPPTRQAR